MLLTTSQVFHPLFREFLNTTLTILRLKSGAALLSDTRARHTTTRKGVLTPEDVKLLMMASHTRATRSRYSSPAQTQNLQNGTLDTPKETLSQSSKFMAKWLEPAIQKKASYEEAGLVKQGVLEGMAPLGAMPKAKKPSGEGGSTVRKIILRPSGSNANAAPSPGEPASASAPKGPAASSSASPQPLPEPALASAPPSPPRRKLPFVAKDEEGDDDYDPKPTGSRRRQSGRVTKGKKPLPSSAPQPANSRPAPPLSIDPEVKDFANKVVEAAVDEAIQHYRYPTAYALRTLYDERSSEPGFVAMIEDIFSQTADADTVTEFASLLEEKKRKGKKGDLGVHFFAATTTSTRETPQKPKPAPYAKMLKDHNPDANDQGVTPRAAKKIKIRHSRTPSKGNGMAAATLDASKIKTPSSRKRDRRESGSSDSSLSTTMTLSPFDTHGKRSAAIPQSPVSPSARGPATSTCAADGAQTSTTDNANDGSNPQPITTRGKTFVAPASKGKGVSSASSDSHSPSLTHQHLHQQQRPSRRSRVGRSSSPAVDDARMPGRISAVNLFPNLPRKTSSPPPKQDAETKDLENKDEEHWEKKWEAKRVTEDYTAQHSFLRGSSPDEKATPKVTTRKTRQSLLPSTGTRATRSASKRPNDDAEDTFSPRAPSWNGDASSTVGSRAVTPSSLRPAAKKVKTGIRIKLSPIKKKGAAGGLPRPVGEAQAAPNGGSREQTTDNDEYCSACGNAGDVLCCDGCPRSFHFECVDMEQDELPDEWYCNECLFRRFPRRIPVHKGIFGGALNNLEKTNPRAFSLPKKVQNRFDGVKAGPDGDYDEVVSKQSRDKKRNVYDENAGTYPMREDGRPILCHNCQKGDSSPQELVPCSTCPLWWHLHCLETPAAHMPNRKTWQCPAHVADVTAEGHPLAPAHRFRKLKNAQVITPALGRGLKNNGQIELDWGDEPEPMHTGWPDTQSFGRSYKLPVNGVILDFVEQLRRSGAGYGPRQEEPKWIQTTALPAVQPEAPLKGSAMARHLQEVQASLTLTSLQRNRSEGVEQLTSALLNAADPNVLALMAKTNADNIEMGKLTDDDRLGLRAMMLQMDAISARIRKTLGEDSASAASALASPGATSIAEDTPVSSPRDKLQAVAPITEPTPPSTIGQGEGAMDLD